MEGVTFGRCRPTNCYNTCGLDRFGALIFHNMLIEIGVWLWRDRLGASPLGQMWGMPQWQSGPFTHVTSHIAYSHSAASSFEGSVNFVPSLSVNEV